MSKFVEMIKTKPFIFITALLSLVIIVTLAFVITPNAQPKNPASEINYISNSEIFKSGKKADGSFEVYTISFNAPQGFSSPVVNYSYNVDATITKGKFVEVEFNITQGATFWISISSKNYKTKKFHFDCTPYIQSLNMKFNLKDSNNRTYTLSNEGTSEYKLLYLTKSANYQQAILDKFPSKVSYSIYSNAKEFEDRFSLTTNNNVLKVENNTITPLTVGKCCITLTATDDSNFSQKLYFSVCEVPVASISNLPTEATINILESTSLKLQGYEIFPSYADVSCFDYENDIVKLTNMTIQAKKTGTTTLVFTNHQNEELHQMTIHVVASAEPIAPPADNNNENQNGQKFLLELGENSNPNILFDSTTNTFVLNLADFQNNRATLKVEISVENNPTAVNFDPTYTINDDSSIILSIDSLLENAGLVIMLDTPGTASITITNTALNLELTFHIVVR